MTIDDNIIINDNYCGVASREIEQIFLFLTTGELIQKAASGARQKAARCAGFSMTTRGRFRELVRQWMTIDDNIIIDDNFHRDFFVKVYTANVGSSGAAFGTAHQPSADSCCTISPSPSGFVLDCVLS